MEKERLKSIKELGRLTPRREEKRFLSGTARQGEANIKPPERVFIFVKDKKAGQLVRPGLAGDEVYAPSPGRQDA